MKKLNPLILSIFSSMLLLLSSNVSHAAMYKYVKKDGSTLLTGERLKGSGYKLVKIYKIKKSGAYKNSTRKHAKSGGVSKKFRKKRAGWKKKYKSSKRISSRRNANSKIVSPNGRDNGIIVGCSNPDHLNKQAQVYRKPIQIYSRIYDVDVELIHAIVRQESCFNEGAHSRVGAIGLMQLMPQTALGLRINDPWNPEHNIQGGIKYISQMLSLFDGDYKLAIAAYNAGPGNVNKYGGIPPFNETRNYVKKVYGEYQRLKKDGIKYTNTIRLAAN